MAKSSVLKLIGHVNNHPAVKFVGHVGTALEVGKAAVDVAGSDAVKGAVSGVVGGFKRLLGISGAQDAPTNTAGADATSVATPAADRPEATPVAVDVGARPARPSTHAHQSNCRDLLSKQATALRQQYQAQLQAALSNQAQMPTFDPSLYAQFGMPGGGMGYYDPSMYSAQPDQYYGMPGVYGVNGLPINPPSVGNAPPENCTPCQLAARRGAVVAGLSPIVVGETPPDWAPDGETMETGCWVAGQFTEDDEGGMHFVPDPEE